MPAGGRQQLPHRPVVRDRVVPRHDRAEPEPALGVGREQPAQVARRLDARLLDVVETVLVGLPHVHRRTGQRLTVRTGHPPRHQAGRALVVEVDVLAELPLRGLHHVERPQHGGLRGRAAGAVVDRLHQHRDAQDVGQQDELLPHLVAHVPGAGEEVDREAPLLLGQLHLLDERVQMLDQRGQHPPQPRIRRAGEAGGHHLRRPLLGEQLPAAHAVTSVLTRSFPRALPWAMGTRASSTACSRGTTFSTSSEARSRWARRSSAAGRFVSHTCATVVITSISRRIRSTALKDTSFLGRPTSSTVPPRRVSRCTRDMPSASPLASTVTSARSDPVSSRTTSSGSASLASTVWVAPSRVATSRRPGSTSTATTAPAPAATAPATMKEPMAPAPCTTTTSSCRMRLRSTAWKPTARGCARAALSSDTCGAIGYSIAAGTVMRSVSPPSADKPKVQ